MKVLISGSRDWLDEELILERLSKLPKDTVIIEGGARGADRLSKVVAERLGLEVVEFPADWEKYGKAAGPIRNRRMLSESPDLVIAFHEDLSKSRGTRDTVEEARRRGIKVEVIGRRGD